jgi:hypothetical protein
MLDFFSDLGLFILLVLERWQAYVTGGALVAFLAAAQRIWGYAPSRRTYMNVFVIGFLFVAFFLVWREEYKKNKPMLRVEWERTSFSMAVLDDDPTQRVVCLPLLQIRNRGDLPMGIENFGITYTSANEDMTLQLDPFVTGKLEIRFGGQLITVKPEDTFFTKMEKLIDAHGGQVVGYLPFLLPRTEWDRLEGAKITICFNDIKGNPYCIQRTLTDLRSATKMEDLRRYPGERVQ